MRVEINSFYIYSNQLEDLENKFENFKLEYANSVFEELKEKFKKEYIEKLDDVKINLFIF